jgi:2-polyprenyl-6-hydroxyphenyl methylase/3-demethylubiquinone-9 3-methyltransferase
MMADEFKFASADAEHTAQYLLPAVLRILAGEGQAAKTSIFDLGCGNGATAEIFERHGYEVVGVDPSTSGIREAHRAYPNLQLFVGSAYDDLAARFGKFQVVLSLEVVEHVYYPRKFAATLFSLVRPGGLAIVSTPYHGYLKNVGMALSGKLDSHFTALWDEGHIKFWSILTLKELLIEAGFSGISFQRVGRIPVFAKSMIAVARRPQNT